MSTTTDRQRKLRETAARVAKLWGGGITPLEATQLALDYYAEKLQRAQEHSVEDGLVSSLQDYEIESAVKLLSRTHGSFTNNDLLDEIFGKDAVIFEPHSVKIELGRALRALGYELKQIRRRGEGRILAWRKVELNHPLDNGGTTSL